MIIISHIIHCLDKQPPMFVHLAALSLQMGCEWYCLAQRYNNHMNGRGRSGDTGTVSSGLAGSMAVALCPPEVRRRRTRAAFVVPNRYSKQNGQLKSATNNNQ